MEYSIPFRKTCRTIGFAGQEMTSDREGGQQTRFSWDFMVRIQVTIYSTSKLTEEDFVFASYFLLFPLPFAFAGSVFSLRFALPRLLCIYVRAIAILFYWIFASSLISGLPSSRPFCLYIYIDSFSLVYPKSGFPKKTSKVVLTKSFRSMVFYFQSPSTSASFGFVFFLSRIRFFSPEKTDSGKVTLISHFTF